MAYALLINHERERERERERETYTYSHTYATVFLLPPTRQNLLLRRRGDVKSKPQRGRGSGCSS